MLSDLHYGDIMCLWCKQWTEGGKKDNSNGASLGEGRAIQKMSRRQNRQDVMGNWPQEKMKSQLVPWFPISATKVTLLNIC